MINKMQNSDGIIIILSYPDTIVRPAYWEVLSNFWTKIGVGCEHGVQAGHAALLLIKKGTSEINYFDFGRYITSYGNGRVRSKETDPELEVAIAAQFNNNELLNLEEILLWIENHPEKTHGDGRLIAGIHEEVNFNKAKKFIHQLIKEKEIPYGVFKKTATNCARFVTDTIIASSENKKIGKQLKKSKLLTPSPIGNVIKATTNNTIYEVYRQQISNYKNRSIVKEYKAFFVNNFGDILDIKGTEVPDLDIFELKKATWLGGIGSGAWFKIEDKIDNETYKISRHTPKGEKDFEGLFSLKAPDFNPLEDYEFIYPTNCQEVYIEQNTKTFCLLKTS
jgi:hypothetical protein